MTTVKQKMIVLGYFDHLKDANTRYTS